MSKKNFLNKQNQISLFEKLLSEVLRLKNRLEVFSLKDGYPALDKLRDAYLKLLKKASDLTGIKYKSLVPSRNIPDGTSLGMLQEKAAISGDLASIEEDIKNRIIGIKKQFQKSSALAKEIIIRELNFNKEIKPMFRILLDNKTGAMSRRIAEHLRAQNDRGLLKTFLEYTSGDMEYVRRTYEGLIKQRLEGVLKKSLGKKAAEEELGLAYLEAKDDLIEREKSNSVRREISKKPPDADTGKAGYRVWYKDSDTKGKPINVKEKDGIIASPKNFGLVIVRDETRTQILINGKESKRPPGKLAYRILSYVLKHKGSGGSAQNLAKHIWGMKEVVDFKDARELIKAVKIQPKIERIKIEEIKPEMDEVSGKVRRRITDLNKYFLRKLNTKLEANDMDEYELTRVPKYCLIEKN